MSARPRPKSARTEHDLQSAIVAHCTGLLRGMVRDRFASIPNGATLAGDARRRAMQMGRLKAEGLRVGMPDMVFWRDGGRVLFIEVKNGQSGRVSPEQREVHDGLRAAGFEVAVARSVFEAHEAITEFYKS